MASVPPVSRLRVAVVLLVLSSARVALPFLTLKVAVVPNPSPMVIAALLLTKWALPLLAVPSIVSEPEFDPTLPRTSAAVLPRVEKVPPLMSMEPLEPLPMTRPRKFGPVFEVLA
jgi:hypothetical protein